MRAALTHKRQRLLCEFQALGADRVGFATSEMSYISAPSDCVERNEFLASLPARHICDAYACVGGDSLQFMAVKPEARIDCVQPADSLETMERCVRLHRNVHGFHSAFPTPRVRVVKLPIHAHILADGCASVDFLYCDPPWGPAEGDGQLLSPEELIQNLCYDVAYPLRAAGSRPRWICFKVPHDWETFQPILDCFLGYLHAKSTPSTGGKFWFHFIEAGEA